MGKTQDLKFGFGDFKEEIEFEILQKGYHFFNRSMKDSHPTPFPGFPIIKEEDVKVGDIYAIRAFINQSVGPVQKIDTGLMDIQITMKGNDVVSGKILTILPENFPFAKNEVIIVKVDELLYKKNY